VLAQVRVMSPGAAAIAARGAEFRQRLAAARLRLARTVTATDAERQALASPDVHDLGKAAVGEMLAGLLERLEGHERHELDEIDAAQARLQAGVYGVCEMCHQPVPLARLRAMPAARRCAVCQARHEQQVRHEQSEREAGR
jgi:RNA polymerase-binding transcription factor DksA